MCLVFGDDWRCLRETCNTLSEWMHYCPNFIDSLCTQWHLPQLPPPRCLEQVLDPLDKRLDHHDFTNCPALKLHESDHLWDDGVRRLQIQVDNQTLADLVNGCAVLKEEEYRPAFIRILRNLAKLVELGWSPRQSHAAMVVWHPRQYNNVADHFANHALEQQKAWKDVVKLQGHGRLKLCSDGGYTGTCGAAAYALFSMSDEKAELLATGGCYLQTCKSAFEAEVIGLDIALRDLLESVYM